MKQQNIVSTLNICALEELSADEQRLVAAAIEATRSSYAPYSHFHVGAAVMLESGDIVKGCNQENAAYPTTICAERAALFAAGAQQPDQPVRAIAIAARNAAGLTPEPVTPCGSCRQAMVETETRYGQPIRIILYGQNRIFALDGVKNLMPLSFAEF